MTKEATGCHLISIHNIAFQLDLMRDIRQAIIEVCLRSGVCYCDIVTSLCRTGFRHLCTHSWPSTTLTVRYRGGSSSLLPQWASILMAARRRSACCDVL